MKTWKRFAAAAMAAVMLAMQGAALPASSVTVSGAADDCHDDWLHVEGDKIVDMNGNEVWLTGVNWFGYNVGTQVFDGVWSINMHKALNEIADHGFNLLRVPMSTQIILQWKNGEPDPLIKVNATENPELVEEFDANGTPVKYMYSFDIWNKAVEWCKENGIKIMMDVHCATTNAAGHNYALWYDSNYSEEDWLEALSWFSEYYKDDDTIIAIDLKNEPHGKKDDGIFAKWDGSSDPNNWRYAAEKGAMACLEQNPNLLIMVEGIEVYPKTEKGFDWNSPSTDYGHYGDPEYQPYYGAWWGANFRGVRDYPVNLGKYQSQLVYSPHDYGPLVYPQSWFHLEGESPNFTSYEFDRDSIMEEYWKDTWAYICEDHIAPLLMGEWGGWVDDEHDPSGANRQWLTILRDYMVEKHIHHTFWCFNENSSDTGGLIASKCNWAHWDEVKYAFVKPSLWQDDNGVFISLDHQIPIGANGQSLNEYYSGTGPAVRPPVQTTEAPAVTTAAPAETTAPAQETTAIQTTAGSTPKWVPGDADCSGATDVSDAVLVSKYSVGDDTVIITDAGLHNADIDGKAGVTSGDALTIVLIIIGLVDADSLKPAE